MVTVGGWNLTKRVIQHANINIYAAYKMKFPGTKVRIKDVSQDIVTIYGECTNKDLIRIRRCYSTLTIRHETS